MLVFVLGTTACGGASFAGGVYRGHGVAYEVSPLGEGWRSVDVGDHNDLAWRNDALSSIVQINSTCEADMDVPLQALTNHLLIGFTEREIQSQELQPLDGRESLVTSLSAKLDGVPRSLLLVVMKKDGCVYDMALISADAAAFDSARPAFDSLRGSFHTVDVP